MSRHGRRKPAREPHAERQPIATCPACGKRAFVSKRVAKLAARTRFPGERMRFYRCPDPDVAWWHMTSQDAERSAAMRRRHSLT